MKKPFINRVVIKNFKSIAYCNVQLGPLQFLVGRNGSGKSNFLDAFAFVRDALAENLEQAFSIREGINQVRRRSGGHPQNFGMSLEFSLTNGNIGTYTFEITSRKNEKFYVKRELANIEKDGSDIASYETENGKIKKTPKNIAMPPIVADRLYLQNMSTFEEYRPLYDALRTMGIYNLNPKLMADMHRAEMPAILKSRGENIAASVSGLEESARDKIRDYLQKIVPFVSGFDTKLLGGSHQRVQFSQEVKSQRHSWRFDAASMSDGTLRALGILTALLQAYKHEKNEFPVLVGIEEPETGLHAHAVVNMLSALEEASEEKRQVIVTTHSAEMLDTEEVTHDKVLVVELKDAETCIGALEDDMPKELLKNHLITAGELLRQGKLKPDLLPSMYSMPLFRNKK